MRALDDRCEESLARRVPFVHIENVMRDLGLRGAAQTSENRAVVPDALANRSLADCSASVERIGLIAALRI
jgi:hypothetical protein